MNNDVSLYIYDKNFNLVTIIDEWISLIWTAKYNEGYGGFDLEVPATKENLKIFKTDYYVSRSDKLSWLPYAKSQGCPSMNYCNDIMIIEAVELSTDSDGISHLCIGGSDITCILERRINVNPIEITDEARYGFWGHVAIVIENGKRGLPISELYFPKYQYYYKTQYGSHGYITPAHWGDWVDAVGDMSICKDLGFLSEFADNIAAAIYCDDTLNLPCKKLNFVPELRSNTVSIDATYLSIIEKAYAPTVDTINFQIKVGTFIRLSDLDYYYIAAQDSDYGGTTDYTEGFWHVSVNVRRYKCIKVTPSGKPDVPFVKYKEFFTLWSSPSLSSDEISAINLLCFHKEATQFIAPYNLAVPSATASIITDEDYSPMYAWAESYYLQESGSETLLLHNEECDLLILGGGTYSRTENNNTVHGYGYVYFVTLTEISKIKTPAWQCAKKIEHENYYEIISDVCKESDVGFRLYPQGALDNKPLGSYPLKWAIYDGEDRTQSEDYVEFSANMENLISAKMTENIQNYKNIAYVTSKYPANPADDNIKEIDLTTNTATAAEDIYRREIHIDANDINYRDGEDGPIIRIDSFRDLLVQKGKEELNDEKNRQQTEWDCEIIADGSMYRLNENYFLGDKIVIKDIFGNKTAARIQETEESWDNEGYQVKLKLKYLPDVAAAADGAILTEGGDIITTESNDYIEF